MMLWIVTLALAIRVQQTQELIPRVFHLRHGRQDPTAAAANATDDADDADDADDDTAANGTAADTAAADAAPTAAGTDQEAWAGTSQGATGGGLPISTCGGLLDDEGQVQMSKEHGVPCKFPFPYNGTMYNSCTDVDSGGVGEWCRTKFPGPNDDPDGPIRWALCNHDGKPCPENHVAMGRVKAAKAVAAQIEQQLLLLEKFFSWRYWELMVLCSLTLLLFSEFIGPAVDKRMGAGHEFYSNGFVFVMQMVCFFLVACTFNTPEAGASSHILALSTVMVVLSVFVLMTMAMVFIRTKMPKNKEDRGKRSWTMGLLDDMSEMLRPFSRTVAAFLLIYGVLTDIDTQWAGIAAFGGLMVMGVAMATTSIISDFLAYIFIRTNHWFTEGDMIYYGGDLVQVKDIHWRYTQVFKFANKCMMYVPNGRLGNAELLNQSQDSGRMVVKNIPLDPRLKGAALEAIVKDIWALLKGYDGQKFESISGKQFDNQIDIGGSSVLISDNSAVASARALNAVMLTIKLKGLFYYSKAPPFTGEGDAPDWRDRQWDWAAPWNFQQERVLIDVQKVLDKHTSALKD